MRASRRIGELLRLPQGWAVHLLPIILWPSRLLLRVRVAGNKRRSMGQLMKSEADAEARGWLSRSEARF